MASVREMLAAFRGELRPTLALAIPVVLAELGWMGMGTVDTMMVGRLGAEAIGATALAHSFYNTLGLAGLGLLLGMDTVIAQAFGARDLRRCHHALCQGLWMALGLTPLLWGALLLVVPALPAFGIHPALLSDTAAIVRIEAFGLLPLLLYVACRRYLQSMSLVAPITFALISANLVNWLGNWLLIYGNGGLPRLGVLGSAWATVIARVYMAAVLGGYILWRERRKEYGLLHDVIGPRWEQIRQLIQLGAPAAVQITLEVGVFSAATILVGALSPAMLAAHQIALNVASLTFMVPLGISSAAAVRVGQAIGAGDSASARRAGWTALVLGSSFMACSALMLLAIPHAITRVYTTDASLYALTASLLAIAGVFQLFDGTQTVAIGALRGAGDTRTPMIMNVIGYWVLGLPIGWLLCFRIGWQAQGVWVGLCIGLMFVALTLLVRWSRLSAGPMTRVA